MSERKLASVRKIKSIEPIEGADKIVKATVDGWELVTQKSNEFQPDDLVVYLEIDSLLPISEQFSWLEPYKVSAKNSVNGEGYRLKTIKLRGQVSQGLILPLGDILDGFPEYFRVGDRGEWMVYDDNYQVWEIVKEGVDLTALMNVKKYEKPIPANLAGKIRGNFPSFIPKTDQERIQNCFDKFWNKWRDDEWEATIKLDGSSFTAYYDQYNDRLGVCSRNLDLIETEENSFWQVARQLDLENKLRSVFEAHGLAIAIQGELMGPGVQGNREQLDKLQIFVFDIIDITDHQMVNYQPEYWDSYRRGLLSLELDLPHVPVIEEDVFSGFDSVKKFLAYAERPSLNHPNAEGVVFKNLRDPSISFKVIANSYLLGEK